MIYSPDIRLSNNDRLLLTALSKHVISALENQVSEQSFDEVVLVSHDDAVKLLKMLKQKLGDPDFVKKAYFCNQIFSPSRDAEERCKRIFLDGRKKSGRKNVLSSAKWEDFKARLGITSYTRYSVSLEMDYKHFLKMESKLLRALKLHPAVIDLLMHLLYEESRFLQQVRSGKIAAEDASVLTPIKLIIDQLDKDLSTRKNRVSIPTTRLLSTILVTSDMSVLFTTRDWSTAGTISTLSYHSVLVAKSPD